jgi:hypothetical protein
LRSSIKSSTVIDGATVNIRDAATAIFDDVVLDLNTGGPAIKSINTRVQVRKSIIQNTNDRLIFV